jgi:hypothetical protein
VDIRHYTSEDNEVIAALPPERHPDYIYSPKPIAPLPPVGHSILLESYHNPRNGAERNACILRTPTYRLDKIPLRHDDGLGEGCGLETIGDRKWEIF